MNIRVTRNIFAEKQTIGDLYINGIYFCHTLEDIVREDGKKVLHETAIPYGEYNLVMDYSDRFKQIMPHILDVPNFTGIRIHSGNTEADTSGCILVGYDHIIKNFSHSIAKSRQAYTDLCSKIYIALADSQKVTISIIKSIEPIIIAQETIHDKAVVS